MARYILNKNPSDGVKTFELKNVIKDVIRKTNTKFDELQFEKDWKNSYPDERCSIAHGRGSRLIDPRLSIEYDRLANMVGFWAREVVYYYINKYKI